MLGESSQPFATQAGVEILRKGGNAAVSLQSCNIFLRSAQVTDS